MKLLVNVLISGCTFLLSGSARTESHTQTFTPLRADDACNFVGVNARIGSDPKYFEGAKWSVTRPLLRDLNVRNLRFGIGWKGLQNTAPAVYGYDLFIYSPEHKEHAGVAFANHGIRSLILVGGIYQQGWVDAGAVAPGGSWNPAGTVHHINTGLIDTQLQAIKNDFVNGPYGDCVFAIEGDQFLRLLQPERGTGQVQ